MSQTKKKYNLDFESYDQLTIFPKKWFEWGNYRLSADTINIHSGRYAAKIASNENGDSFGCIAYKIPANYKGQSIRLEGYMKIKNVKDGFSGLMLRIDNDKQTLAFNNMENENIHGTKDWKKYSITLPLPEHAKKIIVAGIMTGKGEAWFDDFSLFIDNKNIQNLKEIEKPIPKATLDKEFDTGSNIDFPELTEELINKLELLGKVWGFLKYYHPAIGKGDYNWDYELFRILPNFLEIANHNERDKILLDWIKQYGIIEKCPECKETSSNAIVKPDMSWLQDFDLSSELMDELIHIYQNRSQGEHFYIGYAGTKNPNFTNENHYYSWDYDDKGFKLLALYRYWNIIHYFFPYKHLTNKNWADILKVYIPKFVNSKNKFEYEQNLILLIGEINDTHATTTIGFNNIKNIRGRYYPPFKVQFIEDKLVVTDYYNPELRHLSNLEIGDIITHINNKSVNKILDSVSPYYPSSNKAAKFRDISKDILRSNHEGINIKYLSGNERKQHELPLYIKDSLNMNWYNWTEQKCYRFLNDNIGYINLEHIKKTDVEEIKSIFSKTKGIIIDLRNYPSAFVPYSLGSYFVSSPTPFVKIATFNRDNPGEFNFTDPLKIPKSDKTYSGKLVILINEKTQSQAEFTSMAFIAGNNTTVIGSTTAGADGSVSPIYLPGGLLTRISGNGIYYPDGRETQRIGIVPDIVVEPSIKAIKKGKDELLIKAIEIIDKSY